MTDQTTPDVTDDDRRLAREWAESIKSATNSVEPTTNPWSDRALAAAHVILHDLPAPAPALPDGWRPADHYRIGRVIVTNPTPTPGGHVYFVTSDETVPRGSGWGFCTPGELTYLDTNQETNHDPQ